MTTPQAEEPRKECPMCAGTGKVRDYMINSATSTANTFYVIDPLKIGDFDITPIYGT